MHLLLAIEVELDRALAGARVEGEDLANLAIDRRLGTSEALDTHCPTDELLAALQTTNQDLDTLLVVVLPGDGHRRLLDFNIVPQVRLVHGDRLRRVGARVQQRLDTRVVPLMARVHQRRPRVQRRIHPTLEVLFDMRIGIDCRVGGDEMNELDRILTAAARRLVAAGGATDANGEAYKEHRQIACVDWVNRVGYQVVTHLIDREEDPEFNEGYLINEALPPLIKAGKNPGVQLLFEPVLDTTPPAKKSKRANS